MAGGDSYSETIKDIENYCKISNGMHWENSITSGQNEMHDWIVKINIIIRTFKFSPDNLVCWEGKLRFKIQRNILSILKQQLVVTADHSSRAV
jgi:hypothetical protein